MKDYTDDIELIEKFLGGVMSEEEKNRFESRRANDKEFNAILKDMDLLVEGIKVSAAKSSRDEKLERLSFHAEIMKMEEDATAAEGSAKRVIPLTAVLNFLQSRPRSLCSLPSFRFSM